MYSSREDIQKFVPERSLAQLTDDEAGAAVNEAVVNEAIVAADEVIDAHLRGRYTIPFPETPPILKRISADIAVFHIYGRRESDIPKTIETKYKDAVRMLEAIRDGKLTIGDAEGEKTPEPGTYRTNKTRKQKVFGW